jgi:uncharacterized protein (DUF1330 family)
MPGYIASLVEIHDHEAMNEYIKAVTPTIAAHGGRITTRGSVVEVAEGNLEAHGDLRLVVIEFDSLDTGRRWFASEEYQPLIKLRERGSTATTFFVDGAEPPSRAG